MKKRIIVCSTVIVIISALISGCESEETRSNKMFECVGYNNEVNAKIVYDTETKVMYAFSCDRNMPLRYYPNVRMDELGTPKDVCPHHLGLKDIPCKNGCSACWNQSID